jgi:hypothetical protein
MSLEILRVKSIYEEFYLETFNDRITELHVVPDVVAVGNRSMKPSVAIYWYMYSTAHVAFNTTLRVFCQVLGRIPFEQRKNWASSKAYSGSGLGLGHFLHSALT